MATRLSKRKREPGDTVRRTSTASAIPPALKLAFAIYMMWHVSLGWAQAGWPSLLWVCGLGLEVLFLAVLFESPLLATAVLIGAVPAQFVWGSDLLAGFLLGSTPFNFTDWMFNPSVAADTKIRTLYHVWAPLLTLWLVSRTGFHKRAKTLVLVASVPVLLISAWVRSRPELGMLDNFNLVDNPASFPPYLWLGLLYGGYATLTLAANSFFGYFYSDRGRLLLAPPRQLARYLYATFRGQGSGDRRIAVGGERQRRHRD